ncbi:MAG TPA: DciA family protein [Rhodocyclaceae bacterium]|nr:DciA family protein [Rhodocyclaceae bacterium]
MARMPRSLEDCLKGDAGFARLSTQAARLLKLQRLLDSATPLARYARVANLRVGNVVVIHAATSATAAKLRQLVPSLVAFFRRELPEVTGIDVRVQARAENRPAAPPLPRRSISESQKRGLTSLADRLRADSPLRSALAKLVERSR